MKKELIAYEDPKSPISEIFRTLRTNIQFMNSNKSLKTLLVTSTVPGEGKSWISSNLAIAFAQSGQRVILIDADMRKCGLHQIFKVPQYPGLSNYLSGVNSGMNLGINSSVNSGVNLDVNSSFNDVIKKEYSLKNYLKETDVENLYIMPAGNVPPNPSELLVTPQMVNLLETLKQDSDLIIIDGTPSKLVTDAVILSRIVDSTLIVVGHNYPKKDDLQKIIRDIKNVGGNIAGIVYNKKPISSKKAQENYYYSSTPRGRKKWKK